MRFHRAVQRAANMFEAGMIQPEFFEHLSYEQVILEKSVRRFCRHASILSRARRCVQIHISAGTRF
jgi:hypothetical protein